jgi:hypothetical protein
MKKGGSQAISPHRILLEATRCLFEINLKKQWLTFHPIDQMKKVITNNEDSLS